MPNVNVPGNSSGSTGDYMASGARIADAEAKAKAKKAKQKQRSYGAQQAASQSVPTPAPVHPPAKKTPKAPPPSGYAPGHTQTGQAHGTAKPGSKGSAPSTATTTSTATAGQPARGSHRSGGSGGGGGGNTSDVVRIITQLANKYGVPPALALAVAFHESGLDPNSSGDRGYFDANGTFHPDPNSPPTSFGLFQLHQGGKLGSLTPEQAADPQTNAEVAIRDLATIYKQHPDWDWGKIAAASQNPADHATYATSIDSIVSGQHQSGSNPQAYFSDVAHVTSAPITGGLGAASGGPDAGNVHFDQTELEKHYGAIAVALGDLELQKLVKQAVNNGWDDSTFQAKLEDTKFFKTHTDAQQNWLLLQATRPAEAKAEVDKRRHQIRQEAIAMGVRLTPKDIRDLANETLLNNFDDTKIQQSIGAHFNMQQAHAQGQAGVLQDQFSALAAQYGIKVSPDTVNRWTRQNLVGHATPDTIQSHLQNVAMSMYPGLATELQRGMTVDQVASPYRDSMAQLLELDPASLDVFDPQIRKALQYQADPTKPSTLMPLWQFEQQVRKDPRWLNTSNAKQSAMDTGVQILKDWGLS